jgi:hypothetical protein
MEPVFHVETDPPPDGTLEALREGRTLYDGTGHGYLRRFLISNNLTEYVEWMPVRHRDEDGRFDDQVLAVKIRKRADLP